MNCLRLVLFSLMLSTALISGASASELKGSLKKYIAGKEARIGVAVLLPLGEMVEVNGGEEFPMLSVYKFPQALAVADYCERNDILFSDTISIERKEILENTYSPLREKYGVRDLALPITELLAFSLQQSDNNACDILFRLISGTAYADSVINGMGFHDIHILSTEDEMH